MSRLVVALVVAAALGVGCTAPSAPRQAPPDIGRGDGAAPAGNARDGVASPAPRPCPATAASMPAGRYYAAAPSPASRLRAIAFTWISSVPA